MITRLNQTPTFEWRVVRCVSKSGHQIKTSFKEIELHEPNLLNYSKLSSQHNWGGPIQSFDKEGVLHFDSG